MIPRRLWLLVAALVVAAVALTALDLWRFVTAPVAAVVALVSGLFAALGADRQEPTYGRPRRPGVGGSPSGGGSSETETSPDADGTGADRPQRPNRPRRPGF